MADASVQGGTRSGPAGRFRTFHFFQDLVVGLIPTGYDEPDLQLLSAIGSFLQLNALEQGGITG